MFEVLNSLGLWVKGLILWIADYLTIDSLPGIVAGMILVVACLIGVAMIVITRRQVVTVSKITRLVTHTKNDRGFALEYASICARIEGWPSTGYEGKLSDTWAEFRETVIEPSEESDGIIQNSARPEEFFNTYNLGFGLSRWRFWPGIFVSTGLFLTFLGLVAALVQTGETLERAGTGADQALMTAALSDLLSVASAKFIMSLSGLFASIILGLVIRWCTSKIENAVSLLSHVIERRVQFLSLADIAQKQLGETTELRAHLTKLNSELIAALSKPLEKATSLGGDAAAQMMKGMGEQLSSSLTETITDAGNQMEKAATGMRETTIGLDAVSRRIELVVQEVAKASEGLEKGATPLAESITGTAETARTIGKASLDLVESAGQALEMQTTALTQAAEAIRVQIDAFESRAKAYDGDMENALNVYKTNLDAAISDVQAFSGDVHVQYADALQRLRAVIEGARAYSPEPETDRAVMPQVQGPPAPA